MDDIVGNQQLRRSTWYTFWVYRNFLNCEIRMGAKNAIFSALTIAKRMFGCYNEKRTNVCAG